MKKSFFTFLLLFFCSAFGAESHKVLVSVAPFKFFAEKIADGTVDVVLMVPPGASSHTYEPTPRQMVQASQADIWFTLGEPFEAKAIAALKSQKPELILFDLRAGVDLIQEHSCSHCKNAADPHIWLSPRMAKIEATNIANVLSRVYPEHQQLYEANLQKLLLELDKLDEKIRTILGPNNRVIMVSHPAYAYFGRDYGIRQLSIEFEGKDPTPRMLTNILEEARQNGIRTIFIQRQYSNKAADQVARQIGAKLVNLDPYSEDYLNSMEEIARQFKDSSL